MQKLKTADTEIDATWYEYVHGSCPDVKIKFKDHMNDIRGD